MSILFWAVSADFSGAGVRLRPAGAFPPCRPPPLPLALPFAPYPPSPLPSGKGEIFCYLMQGASPLASPGLNPRGTGSTCRCRRLNGGRAPGVAGSASVSGARRGAFPPCRPPPLPLALLFCPYPPAPFPAGRGRPRLFYARGFAPCIPGVEPAVRRKTDRISLP